MPSSFYNIQKKMIKQTNECDSTDPIQVYEKKKKNWKEMQWKQKDEFYCQLVDWKREKIFCYKNISFLMKWNENFFYIFTRK